ncbi:hypothetical protein QJS66_02440 [Kocuria rhizophila]|nr:hypothetical protein QJS66_02440 [Kocuria rhizophila]
MDQLRDLASEAGRPPAARSPSPRPSARLIRSARGGRHGQRANIGLDRVKLEYDGVIPDTRKPMSRHWSTREARSSSRTAPAPRPGRSPVTHRDLAEDAVVDAVLRRLRDHDPTIPV